MRQLLAVLGIVALALVIVVGGVLWFNQPHSNSNPTVTVSVNGVPYTGTLNGNGTVTVDTQPLTATVSPSPTNNGGTATTDNGQTTAVSSPAPDNGTTPDNGGTATTDPIQTQNPSGSDYNVPPQPQIGHPSFYIETGVPCKGLPAGVKCTQSNVGSHTKHYQFDLVPGTMAIIGGFTVDGVSNGVYKVVRSGHVDTVVTDGFVEAIVNDWAQNEFWFRVGQAVDFKWAHKHVQPLAGWTQPAN